MNRVHSMNCYFYLTEGAQYLARAEFEQSNGYNDFSRIPNR